MAALTILFLIHSIITCQLQEQLIWLQSVHSMNLLNHLWKHPPISLEPQNLGKKDKNEPRYKTNKMHLKQRKALRLLEQERQCEARPTTTRRADQRSPGTQTQSPIPKHRISNLALLLLITTVIPLVEGSTPRLDPETSPHAEYTSLSTEQAITIVGATLLLTTWHLTRTRDDVLPVKFPSDTNSSSEDEYIAMNTAESEYLDRNGKMLLYTAPRDSGSSRTRGWAARAHP
jgi:hypothetical protein